MTNGQPSPLERGLRIFTDVRAGEGRVAVMMFANVLLILCAYYFVKPLREGWLAVSDIEGLTKMELKAYSSFGQSLLLVFVVSAYGKLVAQLPRAVLITRATLFCMSNLVIFWLLQPDFFLANLPGAGIAFYLWVGMFGMFVVAQFWAFAADLYDDEQGKRLLPLIAIGATSGGVVGSWLADTLVSSGWLGSQPPPAGGCTGAARRLDRADPRLRQPGAAWTHGAPRPAAPRASARRRRVVGVQQPLPAGDRPRHHDPELGQHERRERALPRRARDARGAGPPRGDRE
jgi:hypothetical protein